ncbi:hypothetical protein JTB14_033473 [Gonioctena quinquepunctata]|nr:hypothetical protein JTB14_033473 [Gonioctena quinquepunctata]
MYLMKRSENNSQTPSNESTADESNSDDELLENSLNTTIRARRNSVSSDVGLDYEVMRNERGDDKLFKKPVTPD